MRNPKRIKPFLERLGKVWEENCPDWRFGQLMVNVLNEMPSDPFFPEEDEMIDFFENYFQRKEQNGTKEEILQEN